ncbi:hypothetical protein ACFL59_10445 [Planctomycetota bacterium]
MSISGVGPADPTSIDSSSAASAPVSSDAAPAKAAEIVRGTAPARHAFGIALSNDRLGVVSEKDARRIVEAAVKSISQIAGMRESIQPERAFFPGEDSDPHGYTSDYPLVLHMSNPTGSDHGFFTGVNPATSEFDSYSFN